MSRISCLCSIVSTNIHSNLIPNWWELSIFCLSSMLSTKWTVQLLLSDISLVLELMSILLLLWQQELYMVLNTAEPTKLWLECSKKSKPKKTFLNLSTKSKIKTEFFLVSDIESTKTMILGPRLSKTYIIYDLGCLLSVWNLWKRTFDRNCSWTWEDSFVRRVLHQ